MESEPGNSGTLPISSPIIQPTAHMSTAVEYFGQPTIISGARYHLVVTYSVMAQIFELLFSVYTRASPKSATFRQQSAFTKRLRGLQESINNKIQN